MPLLPNRRVFIKIQLSSELKGVFDDLHFIERRSSINEQSEQPFAQSFRFFIPLGYPNTLFFGNTAAYAKVPLLSSDFSKQRKSSKGIETHEKQNIPVSENCRSGLLRTFGCSTPHRLF